MIKLDKFNDTDWYIAEVEDLLIHGNVKNTDKKSILLDEFYEKINDTMKQVFEKYGIYKEYPRLPKITFKEIITLDYAHIKVIKEILDKIGLENIFYRKEIKDNGKVVETILPSWNEIIKLYEKFSEKNINNKIISKSGVAVCPYCNRSFINNRSNSKTSAQLDHFYPKNRYPLFAISLYNLVPSCSACNHIKHKENISVSPYDETYDFEKGYSITYIPKSVDFIQNSDEIEIDFEYKDDRLQTNIKEMKIYNVYQLHHDYVLEIIKKSIVYNSTQINELMSGFPDIFNSKEEIIRLIFGNYIEPKDFNRRPLSRLTRDICIELGINLD